MRNNSAMLVIVLFLLQLPGCLRSKPTAEQTEGAAAMVACVGNHWGENWTQLMGACAGTALELFYDIVAEKEGARLAVDGGPSKTVLYAAQPAIAKRLALKGKRNSGVP